MCEMIDYFVYTDVASHLLSLTLNKYLLTMIHFYSSYY